MPGSQGASGGESYFVESTVTFFRIASPADGRQKCGEKKQHNVYLFVRLTAALNQRSHSVLNHAQNQDMAPNIS